MQQTMNMAALVTTVECQFASHLFPSVKCSCLVQLYLFVGMADTISIDEVLQDIPLYLVLQAELYPVFSQEVQISMS